MVSIMCLRGVGLFWSTKFSPARFATSRKRMGLNTDGSAGGRFFLRDCRRRKAHAPLRKSLRLHTCSGWPICEIVIGLWGCVQNFPAYFEAPPGSSCFLMPARNGDISVPRLCSGTPQHQPVHAPAHVSKVSLVAPLELDSGAPRIPDFAKGLTHGSPIHIAITEVHPSVSVFLALEVFQVNLDYALPQGADPVLRIAIKHHVPDVEPGLNPRALEFSNVLGHLHGAQQKFVPDLFDGDHNFQLLSERKKLADLLLGTTPGVTIGSLRIDNSR